MQSAGSVLDRDWTMLLRGAGVVAREGQATNPAPSRLAQVAWDLVCVADAAVPALQGFAKHVSTNWPAWETWIEHEAPLKHDMPGGKGANWNSDKVDEPLSDLQRLLVLRVWSGCLGVCL